MIGAEDLTLMNALALLLAGALAAAAAVGTWTAADIVRDVALVARDLARRRESIFIAQLRSLEPVEEEAPAVLPLEELYGIAGVPWKPLMAAAAGAGMLLMSPLALEMGFPLMIALGLVAGAAPEAIRRMRIRDARGFILDEVRDFLLALRLRLVLNVNLTAALRDIAESPTEMRRLGILDTRLHHHVSTAAYDLAPEDILARLAEDLRSPELHTLNRRTRSVHTGGRTYAEALQMSMEEVAREINTRQEEEIEGAPNRIIIYAGAVIFFLLLVLFATPLIARAIATITGTPAFAM